MISARYASHMGHQAALTALHTILNNPDYFYPGGNCTVAPSLHNKIKQALQEIEEQLIPVSDDRIKQIVTRVLMHFSIPDMQAQHDVFRQFVHILQPFPEDLLCAAYHHVLSHPLHPGLPAPEDFIVFMEPELLRRKNTHRKLTILLQQTEMELYA